jgi:hypothetical protein
MDLWRIGLLAASAVFFAFLVLRLRPRLGRASEPHSAPGRVLSAEERVWKRLRKLPLPAQRRVFTRLDAALRSQDPNGRNDEDEEPVDS